jgi:plasmid segregation protein ParM
MSRVIATDLGYGWTKAKNGAAFFLQPSLIGEAKELFVEQEREGDLHYSGPEGEFFVGDLALRQSDVKYFSLKEQKAEAWVTEILFKTVLAQLAPRSSFYLVTGLPIDFYFNQRKGFMEMIERFNRCDYYGVDIKQQFKYSAKPTIKQFKIVPQPLGAAMNYLLDNNGQLLRKEEAREQILVVDIGYYTLDLLILDSMEIGKESCSPPGLGVNMAYKLLQSYLKEKIGKSPARYELDRYVLAGKYEGYDIRPLIQKAFKALATQIQNEIDSLNMRFSLCLLTGGASHLIADWLDLPNKIVQEDPQLGNVSGYEKIGHRVWNGSL